MLTKILIIAAYGIITLLIGLYVSRKHHADSYFLADRKLNTFTFIATMTATNLSAFTIFGASGAGYRDGLAFFPVMGFGTGFMAITFLIIGHKIWQLGKIHALITPAELVGKIYNDNKILTILFATILITFTLPYVALQPYAAGKVFHQLFGIPTYLGAILTTIAIAAYTMRGGLKAIAITDIFQGALMFTLLIISLYIVADYHGGLNSAFNKIAAEQSTLLSPKGNNGNYNGSVYFSFILLWFFCDPMFPQIFQRFYAAKSPRVIAICAASYPILCTLIFFIPITIGILGHLTFPNLSRSESDSIMPLLMNQIGGDIFGTLVLTAGIAALMSTLDSQLLTLSSIFTHDILPLFRKSHSQNNTHINTVNTSRIFTVLIAIAGLAIALTTDTTLLKLGMTTFTGLAVLFPTILFGLYLKTPKATSAIFSIIIGELAVIAFHFKLLPTGDFLPAFPIILVTIITYLLIHVLHTKNFPIPTKQQTIIIFILIIFPLIPILLFTTTSAFYYSFVISSIIQFLFIYIHLRKNNKQ